MRLGWIPDVPDLRDHLYLSPHWRATYPEMPLNVDLRDKCPVVTDQGDLGSCTGQAVSALCQYLMDQTPASGFQEASPLFTYYYARLLDGSVQADVGATLRSAVKGARTYGIAPEYLWSYVINDFDIEPSEEARRVALGHQALKYKRILRNEKELMYLLYLGFPFVIGIAVYEKFHNITYSSPVAREPDIDEKLLGGHAVLVVGYDVTKDWFIVRNSWGSSWGENGYFYLPMNYIRNSNLSDDFWVVTLMEESGDS